VAPIAWSWGALSLGSLLAIAAVVYFAYRLRGVLLVLVASVFVAYMLEPLVARLARVPLGGERFVGRKLAAGVVVVAAIGLFALALYWFVPVLWTELARLGGELPRFYQVVEQWFVTMSDRRGMGLSPEVWLKVQAEWHRLLETGAHKAASLVPTVLGSIDDLLGLIVVPIGAFYILTDGGTLTTGFVEGLPARWRPTARLLVTEADRSLETYVRGQTLVVLVCSTLATVLFTALGVRYSFALGVLAGVAEAVPFLGSVAIIGSLALVTSDRGPTYMAVVLGAYVLLNQINNYVINPRLMSSRLELHPFVVILAVLAGSTLGGILGAALALPTTALLVALGGALWGAGRPESRTR
jgi:predicted PurR-regulated permease PerM